MLIRNKEFNFKDNVYIMGILNVTPDSFSDGGKFNSMDKALFHAEQMIKEGADIIDIGGESTRPNHIKISVEEEIERVAPYIDKIRANFDVPISLDSYKSKVIEANIDRIDLINDIWGLKYDEAMAPLIAKSGLPCCLMHNRMEHNYVNFLDDYINDMKETISIAHVAGIKDENIILDGGVGFQKTQDENLTVLNHTEELAALGYPIMIATSRKSLFGYVLDKEVDDRLYGTLATTVVGIMKGASIVRVHDVDANCDVIKVTKSILEETKWTK